MKVLGLDRKEYTLQLSATKNKMRSQAACKSKLQYECGQLIKEKYSGETILEEVHIPSEGFYIDFFLPRRKVAFEINGGQHSKYNPRFHKNLNGFNAAQGRDLAKQEWCSINDIEFYYVSSVDEIKELLGV